MSEETEDDKTVLANISDLKLNQEENRDPCLIKYNGDFLGKRYPIDGELEIGRSDQATITINDSNMSRKHAKIYKVAADYHIQDLGSSNGTFINDEQLNEHKLQDQDMIRLGTSLFKFFASNNPDALIQDKIYRRATIDAGTDLYNKQYLKDSLDQEFARSQKYQLNLSLIYYDLDHFKRVNDTYGHNAGDYILKECSAIAKNQVRPQDTLARFGGEEFIVMLPKTPLDQAVAIGEKIRANCAAHQFILKETQHQQTISVGVATLNPSMQSPHDLLEAADQKLYASKQGGRNRVSS